MNRERLERLTGWQSIETELPSLNQVVIVRYPNGYDGSDVYAWGARLEESDGWLWGVSSCYGGYISPDRDAGLNGIEADDDYPVTHWMLLPEPPAGKP